MAWTWVVEDFNRSDRLLHEDAVGASALTWASYRNGTSGTQAKIQGNAPVPISSGAGSLLTDVEALAGGAPILGVGVETTMLAPGTKNFSLHAAIPPVPGGEAIWFHTFNTSGTIYHLPNLRLARGDEPTVGWVATSVGVPTSNGQSDDTSPLTGDDPNGAATTGDVLRLEVVFGGSITIYKNGTAIMSAATPAGLDATHTLVGAVVNDLWYSDNWRVGVLT